MQPLKVMVVDDELSIRKSLSAWLHKQGYEVQTASSGQEALQLMAKHPSDLLLVDIKMSGMDGLELLEKLKAKHPEAQVVIITAYGSIETAVQAMKEGASDYILKPCDPEQLMLQIQKLAEHRALVLENTELKERLREQEEAGWGDFVADSPAMRKVLQLIKDVAATDSPVLISGETGTGKELAARALHAASHRAYASFVPINCGAQTESLMESELFGHEKGAFTGAVKTRRGRLEIADGGTLFLDEVGDISPKMQVDLLRVLEDKSFCRVGGNQTVQSDFRLVSATHRNLTSLVKEGVFRQDFYYRINVLSIDIPPLRERLEDIGLLAEYFLVRYCLETGKHLNGLSAESLRIMQNYPWPGNVRELKNVMERAVVIARGPVIGAAELSFLEGGAAPQGAQPLTLQEVDLQHIRRTLEAQGNNVTRAAKVLGIDRRTLTRKIQKHGLGNSG